MVAGLKFLSKKSFNPQNLTNQKNVWERQQQEKKEDRRIKERNEQLIRERDDEELAKSRGDTVKLGFLYEAPPGMQEPQKNSTTADYDSDQDDDRKLPASDPKDMLHQRQPGDDDAAAAFRLMLARPANDDGDDNVEDLATGTEAASKSRYALEGSSADVTKTKANLTALEKAVGRRKDGSSAITLDEQVQRFPALANAPRAQGMTNMDIGVSFKPLGTQIRNVRCMACQKWGHSKGDRDCEHQWDPFSGRASTLMTAKQHEEDKEKDSPVDGSEVHLKKSRRDRRDSSSEDSDSSSEESRRERKRRKKRKRHEDKAKRRKDSKHRKRSKSEDSEDQERSRRRKSHKRHRKSDSRHDKSES
jgi:CBF1 interacting corepressor